MENPELYPTVALFYREAPAATSGGRGPLAAVFYLDSRYFGDAADTKARLAAVGIMPILAGIMWPFNKAERRTSPRYDVALDMFYGNGAEMVASTMLEVSEAGLAFSAAITPAPGTEMDFRAMLDPGDLDHGWLAGRCAVVRCERGKIAARIIYLSATNRARLDKLLATLAASQPTSALG